MKANITQFSRTVAVTLRWVTPAALLLALGASVGIAQVYPLKPVRIVVAGSAGGTIDRIGRIVGQLLSESWDQQVVVDNRPGAGGTIGTQLVARARGDGYTLLVTANNFAILPSLRVKMPYNALDDFAPVTLLAWSPHVLVVNPSLPAKSLGELLELARDRPGQLTYASVGTGTAQHVAGEMLKAMAKIDVVHVPYKGGAPASAAIIGGHVDMMFANLSEVAPHIEAGRIRVLAVATRQRVGSLAQVPTVSEVGVPGLESASWFGMVAPAATTKEIIKRINTAVVSSLQAPALRAHLLAQSLYVVGDRPEQFAAFIRSETAKYAQVLSAINITAD
jgi:tripartite-type tricarboxylate transporter receptor subunit TctC